MKKSLSVLVAVFLISFSAFAQKINWFTTEKPELIFSANAALPYNKDLRYDGAGGEFIASANMKELFIDAGFSVQGEKTDFTSRVFYMPTFFNKFQAGLGFNYHHYHYSDIFYENDFLFTARYRWCKGPVFSVETAIGFFLKFDTVEIIKQYKPYFFDFSYEMELLFNWKAFDWLRFYLSIKSIDYFDYPLIGTPFYKFGVDFRFLNIYGIGIDFTLKYVDMFSSAVYLNESILRLCFKVIL